MAFLLVLLSVLAHLGSASASWAQSPPAPAPPQDAAGCGVVVLDLYPHGDHLHVADLHTVSVSGGGVCSEAIFLDDFTLILTVTSPELYVPEGGVAVAGEWDRAEGRDPPSARIAAYRLHGDVADDDGAALAALGREGNDPRLTPDGLGLSFIRPVGSRGSGSLHRVELDGTAERPILPALDDAVTHEWVDGETVAILRSGSPGVLWLAHLSEETLHRVTEDVSPGLARVPDQEAISFVKGDGDQRWVRRMDALSDSFPMLVDTPPGSREHTWMPSGPLGPGPALVMAHEGVLYRFQPGQDRFWHPILNLNPWVVAVDGFSLSPSGLRLAVVVGG